MAWLSPLSPTVRQLSSATRSAPTLFPRPPCLCRLHSPHSSLHTGLPAFGVLSPSIESSLLVSDFRKLRLHNDNCSASSLHCLLQLPGNRPNSGSGVGGLWIWPRHASPTAFPPSPLVQAEPTTQPFSLPLRAHISKMSQFKPSLPRCSTPASLQPPRPPLPLATMMLLLHVNPQSSRSFSKGRASSYSFSGR